MWVQHRVLLQREHNRINESMPCKSVVEEVFTIFHSSEIIKTIVEKYTITYTKKTSHL